jgi:acetyl-CoA carboxylase carboxyltransferase component/biotin carboxyl carrier protein
MAKILLHPIGQELGVALGDVEAEANQTHNAARDAALAEKVRVTRGGWGQKYIDRVHAKGKLTAWERIELLQDEGSRVFEVGTLVNWGVQFAGSRREAPGAGVITAFVQMSGRWTIVIANDNTVASGAWWPRTPEKIERAQKMALKLRLPVVYLVDCSGLFLPEQSRSFSGLTGAGHIFTHNAHLADAGVPQIAAVFGDCIAGGGYMPIISDRVFMTEGAYMVIAGAALIKGAKALALTSLDIGGPEVHVHQSACADVRVPDDVTALQLVQEEVARLPTPATEFYRYGAEADEPRFPATDLTSLFPKDFRHTYAIEDVIGRLVDGSLFHEVLTHVGREMITGVARVSGLWVGFIANRQGLIDEPGRPRRPGSALYREGIAKISTFSRACADDGLPIVWLQDIAGFDIGVEAERQGLLGYGSNLIYANSTTQTPVFTILLRKASGAGYYAMSGMPYEPVVQLATPITRLAVMEGRTLAIATYNSKLDADFEIATDDPDERAAIEAGMERVASRIEADMDPIEAASRMDTDEVVPLSDLRAWLECLVQSAWQSTGYRRTKNPRIWTLHDLDVIAPGEGTGEPLTAAKADDAVACPSVGHWRPAVGEGCVVGRGLLLGHLVRHGRSHPVTAPDVMGVASGVRPAGPSQYGDVLFELATDVSLDRGAKEPAEVGGPEGATVVRADTDGTVYLRPEPGAAPFAGVGVSVSANGTLALVEVMKTFTPVRAPITGEVVRVLVDDGAGVEAGAPLFWVRPA